MPRFVPVMMYYEQVRPVIQQHQTKIIEYKPTLLMKMSPYASVISIVVSVSSLCIFIYKYTSLFKKKI